MGLKVLMAVCWIFFEKKTTKGNELEKVAITIDYFPL